MRQDVMGEAEGERRLADAFGALDQDGMVALARPVGLGKESLRRRMAEEAGVSSYVTKPYNEADLLDRIRQALILAA